MKTYLILSILIIGSVNYAQRNYNNTFQLIEQNLVYDRIDTAFNCNEIWKLRFINEEANSEYYIEFFYNGKVETGFLKNGLDSSEWRLFSKNKELIHSINFDTLTIDCNKAIQIATENGYKALDSNARFIHEGKGNEDYENGWLVITSEVSDIVWSSTFGVVVNSNTGKTLPYEETIHDNVVFPDITTEASFKGGIDSINTFIKNTSKFEISTTPQNCVIVMFNVETDGSINNVCALSANTGQYKREAERIIKQMKDWEPATNNGTKVSSRETVEINFK